MTKEITIQGEQTLFDIAIQEYGKADPETLWKLLDDNPNIAFDYKARLVDSEDRTTEEGYEVIETGFKDISYPLLAGQTINIDTEYSEKDTVVLNQLDGSVIATGYSEPLNN